MQVQNVEAMALEAGTGRQLKERRAFPENLQESGWNIEGPFGAASILKRHPNTLRFRIKKLGIRRPV